MLKGELRNRFNIISEERVTFSEQNSENLMKIGWKIRKLWHFEVSQIFTKHFLTSRYEYANERVDDVIASLFAIYFVHKFLKNSIFCPKLVIVCFSYQDILELTLFYIYSERNWGKSNVLLAEIWNFCHFCIQSEWKIVRRWHHQLAHLHIHSDWSRTVSWKFAKLKNFITSLFFNQFSSGFHCFVQKILLFLLK